MFLSAHCIMESVASPSGSAVRARSRSPWFGVSIASLVQPEVLVLQGMGEFVREDPLLLGPDGPGRRQEVQLLRVRIVEAERLAGVEIELQLLERSARRQQAQVRRRGGSRRPGPCGPRRSPWPWSSSRAHPVRRAGSASRGTWAPARAAPPPAFRSARTWPDPRRRWEWRRRGTGRGAGVADAVMPADGRAEALGPSVGVAVAGDEPQAATTIARPAGRRSEAGVGNACREFCQARQAAAAAFTVPIDLIHLPAGDRDPPWPGECLEDGRCAPPPSLPELSSSGARTFSRARFPSPRHLFHGVRFLTFWRAPFSSTRSRF